MHKTHESRLTLFVSRQVPGSAFGQEYEEALAHGFLYKKSSFHSKARLSAGVWQKRWMVSATATLDTRIGYHLSLSNHGSLLVTSQAYIMVYHLSSR